MFTSGTDLVEIPDYLFVRVARARDLLACYGHNSWGPYVEVKLGRFKGTTLSFRGHYDPEWNQVFALDKDQIGTEEKTLEIFVKDSAFGNGRYEFDDYIGKVSFAVSDIPKKFPSDSALALQCFGLKDHIGQRRRGELMVSTWMGTQADEAFPDALHLQRIAESIGVYDVTNTRSGIYIMPRIWCLRVNLIQAQDLVLQDGTESENSLIFIQATLGNFTFTSKMVNSNNGNPTWNEDLLIAVAEQEQFDHQHLFLSVEEQGTQGGHKRLGTCVIPIKNEDKRLDGSSVPTKTFGVELHGESAGEILVKLSLDGGYHMFDDEPQCSSDWNPTAKKLWRVKVGDFQMGILDATLLPAMKPGRTDAYCVAKYGPKWVKTRTVVNSLSPKWKWNEQFSWEVYDPSTFITVSVFDNCQLHEGDIASGAMDTRMGRVRICLSELETNRLYSYSYPLVELQPSGLKKMGVIHLAFRFYCPSMINLCKVYTLPQLPALHFSNPLSPSQLSGLRKQTVLLVASKMSKNESPLRREVVEYMLDSREIAWSMRRGRADFERVNILVSKVTAVFAQLDDIRKWKNPYATVLACVILLLVVCHPQLLLPTMFSMMIVYLNQNLYQQYQFIFKGVCSVFFFLVAIFCYFYVPPQRLLATVICLMILINVLQLCLRKPRKLSQVDLQLSHVHTANVDELEEEFDPIPSKFGDNIMRNRYDRLRIAAGKYVALMGDLATKGEKLESLLSWEDFTASLLTMIFFLVMGIVSFIFPLKVIVIFWLLYLLRHPIFRSPFPSPLENWLRRMPSKLDRMI
ncbi:FT-interacting protein 7-like [Lotus japonicus]|uniref:FT-interacting protein 7-like n=1 Tax=Lotus japonicus TaxID=34305 RepID=UPI00258AF95A|nr:FT-interacting protein 7-like [Lotus japonicus]